MKQVNFFPYEIDTFITHLQRSSKVDFKRRGIFSSWKIRGILERRIGHHVDEEREPRFRLYTFSRYPDRGETCPFFLLFQFKFFTWNTALTARTCGIERRIDRSLPESQFPVSAEESRYCFHPVGISSLVGWKRTRIWSVTSFQIVYAKGVCAAAFLRTCRGRTSRLTLLIKKKNVEKEKETENIRF